MVVPVAPVEQAMPQGIPSAINTCVGCVLFGKIQGNYVVEVTNLTLELKMLKDTARSTYSFTAVIILLLMRKRTFPTHNGGKDIE